MKRHSIALMSAAAFAISACGTAAEGGGGGDNLPNRGIVPYDIVTLLRGAVPQPWLFAPTGDAAAMSFGDPSAVTTDDGVTLFGTAQQAGAHFVGRADSTTGLDFGAVESVLDDTPADARNPAVAVDADTGDWHLIFTTADGLLHGTSQDAGRHFTLDAVPYLVADPDDPAEAGGLSGASLVIESGTAHLFYESRPAGRNGGLEEGANADHLAVIRHTAGPVSGGHFDRRTTVLSPGVACVDVTGADFPCWDVAGVGDPEVRSAKTAAGRRVWRLFYVGRSTTAEAIGFAAAFTPDTPFERYAYNPVLKDKALKWGAPSNVQLDDGYLLYFGLTGRRLAVGVAENKNGVASERF